MAAGGGSAGAATLPRLRGGGAGQSAGARARRPLAEILTVGAWLAHSLVSRAAQAASTVRSTPPMCSSTLAPYLGRVLLVELSAAHLQAMFAAIICRHQALGTPISVATLTGSECPLEGTGCPARAARHSGLAPAIASTMWRGMALLTPLPPLAPTTCRRRAGFSGGPMGIGSWRRQPRAERALTAVR